MLIFSVQDRPQQAHITSQITPTAPRLRQLCFQPPLFTAATRCWLLFLFFVLMIWRIERRRRWWRRYLAGGWVAATTAACRTGWRQPYQSVPPLVSQSVTKLTIWKDDFIGLAWSLISHQVIKSLLMLCQFSSATGYSKSKENYDNNETFVEKWLDMRV